MLLRMTNSLSTRSAKEGDQVYLQTASPIAAGGTIVVPVGSYVQGTVTLARRSGRVKGRAELAIHLDTLLVNGRQFKFQPRLDSGDDNNSAQRVKDSEGTIEQGGTKEHDIARIAVLAGSGAAIGGVATETIRDAGIGGGIGGAVGLATVLATRGKEVELRAGSTLDVVFDHPLTIE